MSEQDGKESIVRKATVANVVAGAVILGGLIYAVGSGDGQLVTFLAGGGLGYLFGRARR